MRKIPLFLSFFILSACAQTSYVDTACEFMPRGTMHREDTPITKRWMIDYETARQKKCVA